MFILFVVRYMHSPRVFFIATRQAMLLPGPFKPEDFAVLSLFMARFYKMEIRLLLQSVQKTLGRHSGYLQSISCIETLVALPCYLCNRPFKNSLSLKSSSERSICLSGDSANCKARQGLNYVPSTNSSHGSVHEFTSLSHYTFGHKSAGLRFRTRLCLPVGIVLGETEIY
jgi:hypothetical protein